MAGDHDDFQAVVGKLWARLGLPGPRFSEPGRVQLRIEAVSLDLVDNGRGSLIVEGVAGSLSSDPVARGRQTRQVLETNLGLLLGNEAGVYLKPLPNRETGLAVRTTYSYGTGKLDRLVKKIEDTVQVLEYYLAELKSTTVSQPGRRAPEQASAEAAVIFRP